MYKHIKRFFLFLLPILRTAAIQVLADEITSLAYPERPVRRRYTGYGYTGYGQRPSSYASLSEQRAARDRARVGRRIENRAKWDAAQAILKDEMKNPGFHDVLLVAFDIQASSAEEAHEWLHNHLPPASPGRGDDDIYVDSWWVANDERYDGTDTDSAVFVPKGEQEKARNLLDYQQGEPDTWRF